MKLDFQESEKFDFAGLEKARRPWLCKILGYVLFFMFFILWQFFSNSSKNLQFILPPPSQIIDVLWSHSDRFIFHTLATLKEMVGGFMLASTAAFILAWLMLAFRTLNTVLQPAFIAIQCIPMFTLAPLMILWFGWSYAAIIIPTALMIFFPLTISIYKGLQSTPQALMDLFRQYSATPWQVFCKLQLPWALPHIFAGFRISIAIAGIGAVAGEWAGAQNGLGLLMLESRRAADIPMMFGALACLTFMSLVLYGLVVWMEKQVICRPYKKGKTIKFSLALLVISILLGGCQSKGTPEVRFILDWLPNPNHVPLYAGIEKGFFDEEGINLRILKVIDPSNTVPFLTSKQAEICLTYMPHTLNALSKGAEIVPIGILIQQPLNALIYRKNEGIKTTEDLNGKIVGYCVDGFHNHFLESMLAQRHVVPSEWRNVCFDMVGALAAKQVDVLYGAYWNIEGENLRSWGVETAYLPLSDFGVPTYYELIAVVNAGSTYAEPAFIDAFQKALQKSIDFAVANPEEAFEIYLKANPDKSVNVQKWERNAWQQTFPMLAKQQFIDPSVWNQFAEWLVEKKMIPQDRRNLIVLKQDGRQ